MPAGQGCGYRAAGTQRQHLENVKPKEFGKGLSHQQVQVDSLEGPFSRKMVEEDRSSSLLLQGTASEQTGTHSVHFIDLIKPVTPALRTPMYFFLMNLSFLEMCYTTSVVPQMLVHLLVENKTISMGGCAAQMYAFTLFRLTECCLLAVMAYDHFVAICYPLHYTLLMGPRVCLKLATACWTAGVVVESAQTAWIFTLPFCGTGEIQHIFCDIRPMVKLTCVDTSQNEIVIFAVSVLFIMSPGLLIPCSYILILVSILRIPSTAGKHKAFSTCSSQILIISLFYGTALSTYLEPKTAHSSETDKATTFMYTVVTPAWKPLSYVLRNTEVKEIFKGVLLDKWCKSC
ncbi:olfactory receptor 10A4-like [Tamandua tetradactyla]|uniref:olfactory receptor 10A4-like n=1 Tax=Tamandua tetradactyla TaxID=48850 RepID=UPI0040542795